MSSDGVREGLRQIKEKFNLMNMNAETEDALRVIYYNDYRGFDTTVPSLRRAREYLSAHPEIRRAVYTILNKDKADNNRDRAEIEGAVSILNNGGNANQEELAAQKKYLKYKNKYLELKKSFRQ